MADTVQEILDRYIPYLQDYLSRGIFSEAEVKAIVARRRDSEYLLQRRESRKADYLRYIEAEQNLERLRKLRWARIVRNTPKDVLQQMKQSGSNIGDRHIVSNVNFIFSRLTARFKDDVDLVFQYAQYAKECQNFKVLSQVYTKTLTIHPRNVALWLEAASTEYFHGNKGNTIQNARVLMQRALRINGKSIDLWCGYARLEWHYATKLRGRREVLGVDTQDDEEHGIIHLLRGAAPKLIFKQALQEIPDSVELRMEMLQISTEFPGTDEFFDMIWESLSDDHMKLNTDCWVGKASFAMEYPQRINEKSLDILDEGAKLMPDNQSLFLKSLQFMEDKFSPETIIAKFDDFKNKNDEIYEYYINYLVNNGKPLEALTLLDLVPINDKSAKLALDHARLTLQYSKAKDPKIVAWDILRRTKYSDEVELEMLSLKKELTVNQFKGILEQCRIADNVDMSEGLEEKYMRFMMISGSQEASNTSNLDCIQSENVKNLLQLCSN